MFYLLMLYLVYRNPVEFTTAFNMLIILSTLVKSVKIPIYCLMMQCIAKINMKRRII